MSGYAVTRAYHFSAAHRLANDAFSDEENAELYGQCFRQHGHNYLLQVTVNTNATARRNQFSSHDQVLRAVVPGADFEHELRGRHG